MKHTTTNQKRSAKDAERGQAKESKASITSPLDLLLPYQRSWVFDQSRFKIGLWSRQVGKSFACAAEAVRDCMVRPGTMWVILSSGERQAIEFMEKVKQWAQAFQFAFTGYKEDRDGHAEALIKNAEIRWPNGSRILALPANPNTARGYSANLILDEFAFHEDPEKIWRGIYPSISNPLKGLFKLRIVSTANGKANKFHDLWIRNNSYSHHLVTIHDAVKMGLPIDLKELQEGLDDPDGWAQEFECQFIDNASVLLPYELIATCESLEASQKYVRDLVIRRDLYLGIDIGRKHDLTVVWILENMGDVLWTRGVITMEKMPFRNQLEILDELVSQCTRAAIDSTGIGAMLAEELARLHGAYKVEECQFTPALKQEIFTNMRRKFDDKLVRIPIDKKIREDLHGLQKITSQSGNIRFFAPHNDDGHCDRATALALGIRAASSVIAPDPFLTCTRVNRFSRGMSMRRNRSLA